MSVFVLPQHGEERRIVPLQPAFCIIAYTTRQKGKIGDRRMDRQDPLQAGKERGFRMTTKGARILQIIALVLAAVTAVLCCIVAVRPEWVGITGLGEIRAIPTAALVSSVGFVAVDIFYLVMLVRAKTPGSTKATVIISALLLCILAVVVEPTVYALESRQLQLQELQVGDAAKVIALLSAKQGVRELVRLILFASGALSFLSMGGFWGKHADEAA